LHKIRSESKLKHRLDQNIFLDAEMAKNLTDNISLLSTSKVNGYVQEISLNPFGYLMLSDINVIFIYSNMVKPRSSSFIFFNLNSLEYGEKFPF